jgi:hypothetical protein
MSENGDNPEGRAFTGHPDHPPEEADQPAEENEELLGRSQQKRPGDESGGDAPASTLPGYG